jgi:hypothetical protein
MTITDLMQRYDEVACDCGRVHTTESERRLCLRAQPGWDDLVEGRRIEGGHAGRGRPARRERRPER